MNGAIKRLLTVYGRNEFVAGALGYSDRQYRNIRRKIKRSETLPARTVELINLKLQQLHVMPSHRNAIHAAMLDLSAQPENLRSLTSFYHIVQG